MSGSVRGASEAAAVIATVPYTLSISDIPTTAVSVVVGLISVWLSRAVFVDRENRRLQRRQPFRETAPVTAIAMLIVGVTIYDRHFGNSGAVFMGLGVGWTTVVLLDIMGERVMKAARTILGADTLPPTATKADISGMDGGMTSHERNLPADMQKLLDQVEEHDSSRPR